MWREAAQEYEQVFENPHLKWYYFEIPAVQVLSSSTLPGSTSASGRPAAPGSGMSASSRTGRTPIRASRRSLRRGGNSRRSTRFGPQLQGDESLSWTPRYSQGVLPSIPRSEACRVRTFIHLRTHLLKVRTKPSSNVYLRVHPRAPLVRTNPEFERFDHVGSQHSHDPGFELLLTSAVRPRIFSLAPSTRVLGPNLSRVRTL